MTIFGPIALLIIVFALIASMTIDADEQED